MKYILALLLSSLPLMEQALACDLCSICNSLSTKRLNAGSFRLGVSEQYTDFGTIRTNGKKVSNPDKQFLHSSVTQLSAGYDINDNFSLEFALPYLDRSFRRTEASVSERGSVSGVGDSTLLLRYNPKSFADCESSLLWQFFAGVKMPTGSTHRLGEEAQMEEMSADVMTMGEEMSAVHGHDLTLGSGSWDIPLGVSLYTRRGRYFAAGSLQYTIRNQGDYDYRMANDISWNLGPGYYVIFGHELSVALKANFGGEYKGKDVMAGVKADDTALRHLFLGPEITVDYKDSLSLDLALDLPVDINNSATQITPDLRVRATVLWKF